MTGNGNTKRLEIAAACAFALVVLVRWLPSHFIGIGGVDLSYQIVLHDAFARGLHFGQEIVFNYGPFGFSYAGFDARTFSAGLAIWILVGAAIVAGTYELGRLTFKATRVQGTFVVICALLVGIDIGLYTDPPFMFVSFLLLSTHFAGGRRAVVLFLASAAAVAALVKFTFLLGAVAVVVLIAADDVMRRRLPTALLTFATSFLGCWTFARQPLRILPDYLRGSVEVAAGYSEAMSLTLPWTADAVFLILTGMVMAMLVLGQFAIERSRIGARAILFATGTAATLFLAFKAGFVRQDGKDLITAVMLASVAVVASRGDRRMLAPVLGALLLLGYELDGRNAPRLAEAIARSVAKRVVDGFELLARGTAGRGEERESRLRDVTRDLDFVPDGTTFDVYSQNSALVVALGLTPSWRPALQSYSAYTPRLAELDAAHLRGERAPSTLLVDLSTIDGRFPLADDGPSWPEVIARYAPDGMNGRYLVLSRQQKQGAVSALSGVETRLSVVVGDWIAVPSDGLVFVRINLEPTLLARLESLVVKGPPNWLIVRMSDGRSRGFRIIPGCARAGFLLSPFVATTEDLAQLYADQSALPRVTAIRIMPSPFLETMATVSFSRVDAPQHTR